MRKKISLFFMAVLCAQMISVSGYASDMAAAESYAVSSESQVLSTDVIVRKYRTYNGKVQYRRWNSTKNRWEDPDWIDLP